MKRKRLVSILQTASLAVLLFYSQAAIANDSNWYLIADGTNGETKKFPMTEVGGLVAVDDAYVFSILDVSGNVLADEILKITFEDKSQEATGVNPVERRDNIIRQMAKNKLVLFGVSGELSVYDSKGMLQVKAEASGGETTIDITNLPTGVYVVRAGKLTFKFVKL